jgi:hypothetical protein
MGRYYRYWARGRLELQLLQAQNAAMELNDLPVKTDDLRKAVVKLVARAVLKLAIENPERVEQLASLTKLLLWSEDNDIRRARQKLAERYFHYEATAAYEKDLPHFKAHIDAIASDDSLSREEKLKRVKACFDRLSGDSKPDGVEPDKSKNED